MKTEKKDIFNELLLSEQKGYALNIRLKNSDKPVITAVEKVLHNRIILKPTCIYGHSLERRVITLMEIQSVKRYNALYANPVYERIRAIKSSITEMRQNIDNMKMRQITY